MSPKFVLASSSAERKRLLECVGLPPDCVMAPDIDESKRASETPRAYVERMAREKAAAIAERLDYPALVLGADTISAVGRRVLGKPVDANEARAYFSLFSGRSHRVYTGIALYPTASFKGGTVCAKVVESRIKFAQMTREQIEALVSKEEWRRCSGGYSIRGFAAMYIQSITGSYSSILGLPLYETAQMLRGQPGLRGALRADLDPYTWPA